jgi:hypothetical protein
MKKKEIVMLSIRQVSERLGTPISTVRLWANQGRFSGAELKESPAGQYWAIPETALQGFEKPERGRPAKTKATLGASKRGRKGQ